MPETLASTWHTEMYCPTLETLPREEAIRAIHAALIQLEACGARVYSPELGTDLDNMPAIRTLHACLKKAGHPAGEK